MLKNILVFTGELLVSLLRPSKLFSVALTVLCYVFILKFIKDQGAIDQCIEIDKTVLQ